MRIAPLLALVAAMVGAVGCSSGGSSSPPRPEVATAIVAGSSHVCAVLSSGAVRCWGENSVGELGNPAHLGGVSFTPVLGPVTAPAKLAAGGGHSCARFASGGVSCWGSGLLGQLGNGGWAEQQVTPVAVNGIASAVDVGAGLQHSCALLDTGAVRCWGENDQGELGDPTVATTLPDNRRAAPVDTAGITGATAVVTGADHSCVRLQDASVKCWGGRLNGSPSGSAYHEPVAITSLANVIALDAGGSHDCALVPGNKVKCWADNYFGQLGIGTLVDHPTDAVFVTGIETAIAVTAGIFHSCALLSDGTVACWGQNNRGQLGNGTYTARETTPVAVTGLTGATAVDAGDAFTCALVTGGQVKCWGDNQFGQLGLDPVLVSTSAVPVTVGF